MKSNLPVTGRAYTIPAGVTLMSTTDVNSHITYANSAFIQVSGFDGKELMGQPHNMVRHPDMPRCCGRVWPSTGAQPAHYRHPHGPAVAREAPIVAQQAISTLNIHRLHSSYLLSIPAAVRR